MDIVIDKTCTEVVVDRMNGWYVEILEEYRITKAPTTTPRRVRIVMTLRGEMLKAWTLRIQYENWDPVELMTSESVNIEALTELNNLHLMPLFNRHITRLIYKVDKYRSHIHEIVRLLQKHSMPKNGKRIQIPASHLLLF